jgi:hypothetical protein
MKIQIRKSYLSVIIFTICFTVFYHYLVTPPSYLNKDVCDFAKMEVKGIVIDNIKDSKYNYVEISGLKNSVLIIIKKIMYKKGFSENYYYEKGDSIIKNANSKVFIVKNGKKIAIYQLNCDN